MRPRGRHHQQPGQRALGAQERALRVDRLRRRPRGVGRPAPGRGAVGPRARHGGDSGAARLHRHGPRGDAHLGLRPARHPGHHLQLPLLPRAHRGNGRMGEGQRLRGVQDVRARHHTREVREDSRHGGEALQPAREEAHAPRGAARGLRPEDIRGYQRDFQGPLRLPSAS